MLMELTHAVALGRAEQEKDLERGDGIWKE